MVEKSEGHAERDELRAATLGSPAIVDAKIVEWNGKNFELRRPSLKKQQIIQRNSTEKDGEQDMVKAICLALIESVFVPGTNIQVFERQDIAEMQGRTMSDFVGTFSKALGELSKDTNPEEIEKNFEGAPTA